MKRITCVLLCSLLFVSALHAQSSDVSIGEGKVTSDPLAEAAERQKRLMAELSNAKLVTLAGVVGPSGAVGAQSKGEKKWTLLFPLEAWRLDGGAIDSRKLTIRQLVTANELASMRAKIQPYAVVRLKARIVVDSVFGSPQGLLDEFLGFETKDAELYKQVAVLRAPVTKSDPQLGVLTLDREVSWFTGEVAFAGSRVKLNIDAVDDAAYERAVPHARLIAKSLKSWDQKAREQAAEELLELKNSTWLDEDEKELNAKEFMRRMKLDSITIQPDGSFEFWYDDGDLFWGHSIRVQGSVTDGIRTASMEG